MEKILIIIFLASQFNMLAYAKEDVIKIPLQTAYLA